MRKLAFFIAAFCFLGLWFTVGVVMLVLDSRQPKYSGYKVLPGLEALVQVRFDRWGIPHIYAEQETDAYRVLGFLHAQERLFQMEMTRRVALGQVSEVLGPDWLQTDRLFRTLRLRQTGEAVVARLDADSASMRAADAYLDGVNYFVRTGNTPLEFQLMQIPKREFRLADLVSIGGYHAYRFAQGFEVDPLQTYVRDKYGAQYLADLGVQGYAPDAGGPATDGPAPEEPDIWEEYMRKDLSEARRAPVLPLLEAMVALRHDVDARTRGLPQMVGSNAWALAGSRTESGKPILANDPHMGFSQPSVWWEAHLVVQPADAEEPEFELYGHHLAGSPFAMLGHNRWMGWGVTMLMNDDLDLYVEELRPGADNEVRYRGGWHEISVETEVIQVKDGGQVLYDVRSTPHGPIINDVFPQLGDQVAPVALKWAYHDETNGLVDAFYALAHARNRQQAEAAVRRIHAPGLNIIYADRSGDIAWWAAAKVPWRPDSVNPGFLLDGGSGDAEYQGSWEFEENPQQVNPDSGRLVSANQQPQSISGREFWGYFNIPERARRLDLLLSAQADGWTLEQMQRVQLDTKTDYYARLRRILPVIIEKHLSVNPDVTGAAALSYMWEWNGEHTLESVAPTIFQEFLYQFLQLVYRDELGEQMFRSLLKSKLVDRSFALVLDNPDSPWWDDVSTPQRERRETVIGEAWTRAIRELSSKLGGRPAKWTWSRAHQLLHVHAIGSRKPFDRFFNVGPFPVAGGRETVNNLSNRLEGAVHNVHQGPSTRRLIDFASPGRSLGINPTGQSGYFLSPHYDDQAWLYATGQYRDQLLDAGMIRANRGGQIDFAPR